jgi:hypothetical protein
VRHPEISGSTWNATIKYPFKLISDINTLQSSGKIAAFMLRHTGWQKNVYWTVLGFRGNLFLTGWLYNADSNLSFYAAICNYLQTYIMTEQQLIFLCPMLSNVKSRFSLVIIKLPNCLDSTLVLSFTVSSFTHYASPSFIHLAVCLTTGTTPAPKRALHIVRSRASFFMWEHPLLSLRSSSSFLRLLPHLPVISIPPFIFP